MLEISRYYVVLLVVCILPLVVTDPQTNSRVRIHVPVYKHTKYVTVLKPIPVKVPVEVPVPIPVKSSKHSWESGREFELDAEGAGAKHFTQRTIKPRRQKQTSSRIDKHS